MRPFVSSRICWVMDLIWLLVMGTVTVTSLASLAVSLASLAISLNIARSEAIKADLPGGVVVCPSTDNATCNSTNWANGWIVQSSAAGNPVLNAVPPISAGSTLTEASGLASVTYNSNGSVGAPATFKLCDSRGASMARTVEVNVIGRIASSQTPGFKVDGVTALTCP